MVRAGTIAMLLVAFAGIAASSRPLDEPAINAGTWAHSVVDALKEWSGDHIQIAETALDRTVSHESQEGRFYLLVKYIVRPSLAKEFSGAWLKVHDEAEKAKGAIRINLSKTLTDNLVFYGYEEWESKCDFIKFLKSETSAAKKLVEYITEKDIPLVLTELKPAVPYHKKHGGHRGGSITKRVEAASEALGVVSELMADAADSAQEWLQPEADKSSVESHSGRSPHKAYILVKYIVKPDTAKDFIEAVDAVTKKVAKEESGNIVYGLSKTLTDDFEYYSYAAWEDEDAIKTHLKSSYAQELAKFVKEHSIFAKISPLFPIESLED